MAKNIFGEFVKTYRLKCGLGLREFCRNYGHDAGNWSKLERGLLNPPEKEEDLTSIGEQIGIKKNSEDWMKFFDLASLTRGKIPKDIFDDDEVLEKLPIFFRTTRGIKPSEEDLRRLVEILKK
ncbi:MAG: helix-turn-helix transcriptional regulator [Ignavibacteriae bacterium]|nr:helix-turn-helix transcriptional regulator [Ignavibacteriota bacterium]